MARTSFPQLPQETRPSQPELHPGDPPPEVVRLANRTALLTFFAASAVVLGLVLLPRAFAGGPVLLRLAAALPLLAAAWAVVRVRRLRSELRRARRPDAEHAPAAPPGALGQRARP